jgi:two-component system LytT family response regulator
MNETRKLRVLIVDDEEPARALLAELLGAHPDVEIVGACRDGYEAVERAGALEPDLLLLDIQMPKLDGFEVLELIDRETDVVFVTAYDEYALKAFEVNAVDYLLKPFSAERLDGALERARERRGRSPGLDPAGLAAAARPGNERLTRVVVRDGGQIQIIPVETIDFLMAQGDYVAIHADRRSFLKQQTLQSLGESLDPARFVRIHRSYIMNVQRLVRVEPYAKDSRAAVLADGTELPISRSGYARLRELLG